MHALVVHADHADLKPLGGGNLAQRRQSMHRRAVRADCLLVLGLENHVLPARGFRRPVGRRLHVQQHDVEVVGLRGSAQVVDLGLRILAVACLHLGHEAVVLAGNALERNAEHLMHAGICLGRLEEANAAVVGMTHEGVEAVLAQAALHIAVVGPCAESQPRHFHS